MSCEMKTKIMKLINFEKVEILLEGFNKTTGFVTAVLDLEEKAPEPANA